MAFFVCSGEGAEFWGPWLCQAHPSARHGGGGRRRDSRGPAALYTVPAPQETAGTGDAAYCQATEGGELVVGECHMQSQVEISSNL